MNKQTILAFGMMLFFGLGTATLANTIGSCCKGDSCPMKMKDASDKGVSCCDDCDCCDGDSCPMKKKAKKTAYRIHGVEVASSTHFDCCDHKTNN